MLQNLFARGKTEAKPPPVKSNGLAHHDEPMEPVGDAPLTPAMRRAKAWLDSRLARMRSQGRFTEEAVITPEVAALLLTLNTSNRKYRASRSRRWADTITRGGWKLTHQGIAIDREGVLQDGQHRLSGVVRAGRAAPFQITFGADPDAMFALDGGDKRTLADVLHLAGEANYTVLAAMPGMIRAIEASSPRQNPAAHAPGRDEIETFVAARPLMRESTTVGHGVAQKFKVAPTPIAVAHFLIATKHGASDAVDEFFTKLRLGVDLKTRDAIYVLREDVIPAYFGRRRTERALPPPAALAACIIKAWNLWSRGKSGSIPKVRWKWETVGGTRWDKDAEPFPEVL